MKDSLFILLFACAFVSQIACVNAQLNGAGGFIYHVSIDRSGAIQNFSFHLFARIFGFYQHAFIKRGVVCDEIRDHRHQILPPQTQIAIKGRGSGESCSAFFVFLLTSGGCYLHISTIL